MEAENTTTDAPKQSSLATASLVLALLGCVLALLSFLLHEGLAFCCAFLCCIVSLVLGVVSLVEIRTKHPALKGKRQAIIGICASAIPLIIASFVCWMVYVAVRGEPYDEFHP